MGTYIHTRSSKNTGKLTIQSTDVGAETSKKPNLGRRSVRQWGRGGEGRGGEGRGGEGRGGEGRGGEGRGGEGRGGEGRGGEGRGGEGRGGEGSWSGVEWSGADACWFSDSQVKLVPTLLLSRSLDYYDG